MAKSGTDSSLLQTIPNLPLVTCLMHLHSSSCQELGLSKALFIIVISFSIIPLVLAILAESKGQTTGNNYSLLLLTTVLVPTKLGKGPLNGMSDYCDFRSRGLT